MDLQPFVVAAIVAAFFLTDRLGGRDQVGRRLYQVALGFALAFTVISATTAFLRSDTTNFSDLLGLANGDFGALDNNSGNVTRDAASIKAALGLAFLIIGFLAMQRYSTLPLALAFGGILLVFSSGGVSGTFDVNSLSSNAILGSFFGKASERSDIAHFVVFLAGSLILVAVGWTKWERTPGSFGPPPS